MSAIDRHKIAITRRVFSDRVAQLKQRYDVIENLTDQPLMGAALVEHLRGCVGVLADTGTRMDQTVIAATSTLKVVSNIAVGYDNLDLTALTAARIIATNTPDVLTNATADHAWALLMAAARRVAEADRFVRAGQWNRWEFDGWLGAPVFGQTIGIVGFGRIGQAIAARAQGFGMQILFHTRTRVDSAAAGGQWCELNALLSQSDFVVLVVPGGSGTHHMIAAEQLALLKPSAILVNIARGGVVDDQALIQALKNQQLAAAGLDVFENEPNLNSEFAQLPNAVLTPHIGSATRATRGAMLDRAIKNLDAALSGQMPPDAINPKAFIHP